MREELKEKFARKIVDALMTDQVGANALVDIIEEMISIAISDALRPADNGEKR